jgi:phage FluMu protein Com
MDEYGDQPAPVDGVELRCAGQNCGALLAELISPPYRIQCRRCRVVNSAK